MLKMRRKALDRALNMSQGAAQGDTALQALLGGHYHVSPFEACEFLRSPRDAALLIELLWATAIVS